MTDNIPDRVFGVIREFIYRMLLAYLIFHLVALVAPIGARAETETAAPATAPSPINLQDVRFALAINHYTAQHWQEAFEQFGALADEGHVDAARIALLMWRNSLELYGREFAVPVWRRQSWLLVWHCADDTDNLVCSPLAGR